MNVCGIICEYNPFHNGHAYHIQKAKEISGCDILVCVMSGNAVQRGDMAIADKWKRSEVAIKNGCDLVIELPFPFVVQRGDRFAYGAIEILKQANVSSIVFGSECNDMKTLNAMKDKLLQPIQLKKGISSAKALEEILGERLSSNDMLGAFYLKELENTTITPYCIKRNNAYHSLDTNTPLASARAIRSAFYNQKDISHMTCMSSIDLRPWTWDAYYPYIQTFLLSASKEYLSSLFLMDEGIESLLQKQAKKCSDFSTFMQGCISRRYTRSSIQRTLLHLLTQTSKKEINQLPSLNYLRILAYNKKGQAYLRTLQDKGANIASSFSQIPCAYRELEMRLTNAFAYPYTQDERMVILEREVLPPTRLV